MRGAMHPSHQPRSCALSYALQMAQMSTVCLTHHLEMCPSTFCVMCSPHRERQIVHVVCILPLAVHGVLAGTWHCDWVLRSGTVAAAAAGSVAGHGCWPWVLMAWALSRGCTACSLQPATPMPQFVCIHQVVCLRDGARSPHCIHSDSAARLTRASFIDQGIQVHCIGRDSWRAAAAACTCGCCMHDAQLPAAAASWQHSKTPCMSHSAAWWPVSRPEVECGS